MKQIVKDFFTNNYFVVTILEIMAGMMFFVIIYYALKKGRSNKKGDDNLETYEIKVTLANDIPQIRKLYIKKDLLPFIVFILGAVCLTFSLDVIHISNNLETQRKLFYAGLILMGGCIVYYAVVFLCNGGLKSLVMMSDYSYLKYKKPEYETYEVYESYDGVSKTRYVETITKETNGASDHNVITFILRGIAFIFRLLMLIEFAIVYMFDRFFGAVSYAFLGFLTKKKLLSDARLAYTNFLKWGNNDLGCYNPRRDGIIPIEPYVDPVYNEIPKAIIANLMNISLQKVRGSALEESAGKFLFCGKITDNHVIVTKVSKYETAFTMSTGKVGHLFSCNRGRLVVNADDGTAMPMLYDMNLYMQLLKGKDFEECLNIVNYASTCAQYNLLKKLTVSEKNGREVELMCWKKDNKPFYVKAKLQDITLHDETASYTVNKYVPLKPKKNTDIIEKYYKLIEIPIAVVVVAVTAVVVYYILRIR